MMLHSEFRDGNVPAGFEQRRVLEDALSYLPDGIKTVRVRSDTAGYQHELLKYCETRQNNRFGRPKDEGDPVPVDERAGSRSSKGEAAYTKSESGASG